MPKASVLIVENETVVLHFCSAALRENQESLSGAVRHQNICLANHSAMAPALRLFFLISMLLPILLAFAIVPASAIAQTLSANPVSFNNKTIFIDKYGQVALKTNFALSQRFSEGLAAVLVTGNKWGFIDSHGTLIGKADFDEVNSFSGGRAAVKRGHKWGYIDTHGELVIPCVFDIAEDFSEGLAKVEVGHSVESLGRWNYHAPPNHEFYLDTRGKVVLDGPKLLGGSGFNFSSFHEGLAWMQVYKPSSSPSPPQIILINRTGAAVGVLPREVVLVGDFHNGRARVVMPEKSGYISKTGHIVIPAEFTSARDFSEGLAVIGMNGKFGFIDIVGKLAIKADFAAAESFNEGLALVRIGNRLKYIDRRGAPVITLPSETLFASAFDKGFAGLLLQSTMSYINKEGSAIFVRPLSLEEKKEAESLFKPTERR